MLNKTVFLFPGQGTQYPGMALDLLESSAQAKNVFDTASAVLNRDFVSLIRDSDEETLKRTDVSQIALSAASLAAAASLNEQGIFPAACAGFSLGEYPALCCAKVISLEDCFRLTEARGRLMQEAIDCMQKTADGIMPGMAAVLGLTSGQAEALVAEWKNGGLHDLYVANINSAKQAVVSGSAAALQEAESRFKETGAKRVLRLKVAGPFHSPFMQKAADAFAPILAEVQFGNPAIPIFSNVTGKLIQSGSEARVLALRQIVESVRWTDEEAAINECIKKGQDPVVLLEVGPGKVLQGLWKDSGSDIPCYSAGTAEEINELKGNGII